MRKDDDMEIHIRQQTPTGIKSVLFEGAFSTSGIDAEEELVQFLLDCEMKLNETGKVRVWFYGDPL